MFLWMYVYGGLNQQVTQKDLDMMPGKCKGDGEEVLTKECS